MVIDDAALVNGGGRNLEVHATYPLSFQNQTATLKDQIQVHALTRAWAIHHRSKHGVHLSLEPRR
jgi:hypothetical protein